MSLIKKDNFFTAISLLKNMVHKKSVRTHSKSAYCTAKFSQETSAGQDFHLPEP